MKHHSEQMQTTVAHRSPDVGCPKLRPVTNHETGHSLDRQLVNRARKILRARGSIEQVLPPGLFRDSAWDLILTLFINEEEGTPLFVKQLIVSTAASPTAAMRRIAQLEEAGFLERHPDAHDHRRVTVRLTERGRMAMTTMIGQIFDADEK